MVFLSKYRKTLLSHRLTPELIADILQRGAEHDEPTSTRSGKLFNRASG